MKKAVLFIFFPCTACDEPNRVSAVGVSQRETFQTMLQQIDHQRIYQALLWLKANNYLYTNIAISQTISNHQPQTNPSDIIGSDIIGSDYEEMDFIESCAASQNYVNPDIPIEELLP